MHTVHPPPPPPTMDQPLNLVLPQTVLETETNWQSLTDPKYSLRILLLNLHRKHGMTCFKGLVEPAKVYI